MDLFYDHIFNELSEYIEDKKFVIERVDKLNSIDNNWGGVI